MKMKMTTNRFSGHDLFLLIGTLLLVIGEFSSANAQDPTAWISPSSKLVGQAIPVNLSAGSGCGEEWTFYSQSWYMETGDGDVVDNGSSATFTSDDQGTNVVKYVAVYTKSVGHYTINYHAEAFCHITVDEFGSASYQWTESALSQGRKISLSGFPMPDVAQHQEGESDYKPESTYIDALTLDVRHDTSDIHVPVGSDHFALEVRRSNKQETWNTNSIPRSLRPDLPFGPCWSSAIAPAIKATTTSFGFGPITYSITGYQGQNYSFIERVWREFEEITVGDFVIEPTTSQSALALKGVGFGIENDLWVLSLPNGTKCYYSGTPSVQFDFNPPFGATREMEHRYYPIVRVEDRAGNTMVYGSRTNSIIPSYVEVPATGQKITIITDQLGKRVTSVIDPRGNTNNYHYVELSTNGVTVSNVLSYVERADTGKTNYEYAYLLEEDSRHQNYPSHHPDEYESNHLTIKFIKDSNQNTFTFEHQLSERYDFREYATNSMLYQVGNPLILTQVTAPDNSYITLREEEAIGLENAGTNGFVLHGDRINYVQASDAGAVEWSYHFSDPHFVSDNDAGAYSFYFDYKQLEISDGVGSEFYWFDRPANDVEIFGTQPLVLVSNQTYSGRTTAYQYNATSEYSCFKPSQVTNALDDVTHSTYVDLGFEFQLKTTTDALGRSTAYGFDDFGNRTSVTNFVSGTNSAPIARTEMLYEDPVFTNFMTLKTVVDLDNNGASNLVTEFTAHDFGKVATQTTFPVGYSGTGLTTTYDYDENNNLTYVRDPVGNVTTNGYDALNRLKVIAFFDSANTNSAKCTKEFWYDLRSNKTWEKDENDHYTFFQYDEFNSLTNTVRIMAPSFNPSSVIGTNIYPWNTTWDIVTSSEYNTDGTLFATVDPRGLRTEFQYDDLRRLICTTNGVGSGAPLIISHFDYSGDNCGAITLPPYKFTPTKVTDPRGYETFTVYDALSRVKESRAQITNNIFSVTKNNYDVVGNLTIVSNLMSTVDGNVWQITSTDYDVLSRPYKITFPDSTTNGIFYTSTGLKWKTADTLGRSSTVVYDLAGRPVKTISPALEDGSRAVIETDYDANGNVNWVKDAEGNVTTTIFDYRNRATEIMAPLVFDATDGSYSHPTVTTIYDPIGNVVSVTDAKENTTTNFYDDANRMYESWGPEVDVYEQDSRRPVTTNGFDKGGNIILTFDANEKTVQMQYDAFGRLTNTVDAIENTITFEYDENGNQTALIDGEDNRTEFVYDGLNRKTRTTYKGDGTGSTYEDAVYDLIGNRTKRIDCNGKETHYDYDDLNRLEFVTYPEDADGLIRRRTYIYDDIGNLEAVTENRGYDFYGWNPYLDIPHAAVSYAYDALNRVTNETSVGVTHTYGYDLNGNRTSATYGITGREVEWEYDALNRIAEIRDLTSNYAATNTVSSTNNLQNAIDASSAGTLILVADGTYDPVTLTNAITVKSENGPANCRIHVGQASQPARPATLSGNAQLIGFTLTGGLLTSTNSGAGAFVDVGCLISDCIISSNETALCSDITSPGGKGGGLYLRGTALRCTIVGNTAWNGAGAFLENGASMADCTVTSNTASGINSYGGGLYLQDGASAVNCLIANNSATDGGGLFFEQGGLAQGVTSSSNTVDSIGGAGAFLWAGGTLRNGVIENNTATNSYARGGAGIMFFDEGGLVEDSVIAGNTSVTNAGIHYHYSNSIDPGQLGTVNNSILWNNGSQTEVWNGSGNQTINPSLTNSASGADIPFCSYATSEIRTTKYFYDLNSNPVKRIYPSRVEESRSFDAMNRLLTLKTEAIGRESFEIEYKYDAVGSARQMIQTSENLDGKAPEAIYTWSYDDRYRLTDEEIDITGGTNYFTSYTWDDADNRLTKKAYEDSTLKADITYTNNAYNQISGWYDAVASKDVTYSYDANGSRTNKSVSAGGTTASTSYTYDEDNRLLQASVGSITNTFAYDYRSRRVYRSTSPTNHMYCVFDGGLSIQEYTVPQASSLPIATTLTTEFVRGEGMGGGVGGMVYSIRKDANGKEQILCSHANHRGDVIARSGGDGTLTYFALYEAYGTRPYEWNPDGDPDRQKANTKEEESDLGLLNETMRFRDLETGTFLTRDPIGYGDGPNVYCYVHCNPITHFDALGLADRHAGFEGTGMNWGALPAVWQEEFVDPFNSFLSGVGNLAKQTGQKYAEYASDMGGLGVLTAGQRLFGEGAVSIVEGAYNEVKFALTDTIGYMDSKDKKVENTTMLGALSYMAVEGGGLHAMTKFPLDIGDMRTMGRRGQFADMFGPLRFGDNDLVLGLDMDRLERMTRELGGKNLRQFVNNPKGSFEEILRSSMSKADNIRMDITGVDLSKINGRLNAAGEPFPNNFTNYELHLIKNNREYLNKTTFIRDGVSVSSPF